METKMLTFRHLIAVGLLLLMAGCAASSPKTTYHLLQAGVISAEQAGNWDPSAYLVVGPVSLPSHLNRPQMVMRHGDQTLSFSEHQRWAEPLDEGIARAVAENLARLTGAEKVALYPFNTPKEHSSVRVFMDVVRFDTDEAGKAVFDVRWGVRNGKEKTFTIKHTTLDGLAEGTDQPARAEALSRLIAEFSREVAGTLQKHE
jgi:uncharacterized lipoprotein YmbA